MATPNRYANGHRRRTVQKRVFARDELCWLCKAPVDKTIRTPHPMSPEVHEVVPVSRGGSPYSIANCVLTHRRCNQFIGARTPEELRDRVPKRGAPQPVLTSQQW